MEELWIIGRVLDDGRRQTCANDDGSLKTFTSEAEAVQYINEHLAGSGGEMFPFSIDLTKVKFLMPEGHA